MGFFDIFKNNRQNKNDNNTLDMSQYDSLSNEELLDDRIKAIENSITDNEVDEWVMEESILILKSRNIGIEAVEPLLELIERNPLVSFGRPGAIVHFLESIDGYKEKLVKSIGKVPTLHTIWMLNRCINAHDESENDYKDLLKNVTLRKDIDNSIVDCAKEFLEFQKSESM